MARSPVVRYLRLVKDVLKRDECFTNKQLIVMHELWGQMSEAQRQRVVIYRRRMFDARGRDVRRRIPTD